MRGIMKLKKAALMGMMARNTMVVPCMVNSSLKRAALTRVPSGCASCRRMMSASTPPTRKKKKADTPYRMPMRLWSTVVSQDQMTVPALTLVAGMNAACVAMRVLLFEAQEIGGESLRLPAPHAKVRHERPGFQVARVLDPLRHVLRGVRHQVGPQGLAAPRARAAVGRASPPAPRHE